MTLDLEDSFLALLNISFCSKMLSGRYPLGDVIIEKKCLSVVIFRMFWGALDTLRGLKRTTPDFITVLTQQQSSSDKPHQHIVQNGLRNGNFFSHPPIVHTLCMRVGWGGGPVFYHFKLYNQNTIGLVIPILFEKNIM